ncbi:MAG: hypothetical protein ACON4R_08570 [Akkermansiaceae bacterium]
MRFIRNFGRRFSRSDNRTLEVAPFYDDWPVEIRAGKTRTLDRKLSEVLAGKTMVWQTTVSDEGAIEFSVPNPMKGGRALQLANFGYPCGWL